MKILLAGQFKNWALENHFARYLPQHAEVFIYPAEEVFDEFYQASKFNKIWFRLGLSGIYKKIARELVEKAETVRPDIVWVFKGMRILPEALQTLSRMGIKLANYNPDHPFQFSSRGSGNGNVTNSVGLFDLHLCYSRSVQLRIEQEFGIRTAFLPFGFELNQADFNQINKVAEIPRACFVGNPDGIRVEYLLAAAESGLLVDVYGNDWRQHLPDVPNLQIFDPVYEQDFWVKLRTYRLQLNIFRPHNRGSHNMRTFEVPGAGGIMLAPDSPEHREFFEEGKEAFFYQSKDEMVEKARQILALPAAQAAEILQRARQRSVSSGYSYEDRTRQAAQAFEQLLKGHKEKPEATLF
jgi:spore maturation protein CgeB